MFAAYFCEKNHPLPDIEHRFSRALSPFETPFSGHTISNSASLITLHEIIPKTVNFHTTKDDCTAIFWGRLDNQDYLEKLLSTKKTITTAELIFIAWEKWGQDFPTHLSGDFAFALNFPQENRIILGRDAVGIRPLYYHLNSSAVICATTPKAILNVVGAQLEKNHRWIAMFLVSPGLEAHPIETAYQGLLKVRPGHLLVIDNGKIAHDHEWHKWQNTPETTKKSDPKWVDRHREKFIRAVTSRVTGQTILCETSAGIDSSSIISVLADFFAPVQSSRLLGYGSTEGALADQLILDRNIQKGGLEAVIAKFDYLAPANGEYDLAIMGYPISQTSYIPKEVLEQYRQNRGIKVVFSGFGGDEVATSHAFGFAQECLDRRDFAQFYRIQKGNFLTKFLRTVKRIFTLPHTDDTYIQKMIEHTWSETILRPSAITKYNLTKYLDLITFSRGLNAHVNTHIIEKELKNPNITNRFECHSIFANAAGVEYRWPFWDVDLIQNYLNTPSVEKYGPNATARYLHKRAMDGLVPDAINWRVSKNLEVDDFYRRATDAHFEKFTTTFEQVLATWHCDLDEFVDRHKLEKQFTHSKIQNVDRKTYGKYHEALYALKRINDWFNNDP
jgi:asparagine synthase (glutamine-hydrolysing)